VRSFSAQRDRRRQIRTRDNQSRLPSGDHLPQLAQHAAKVGQVRPGAAGPVGELDPSYASLGRFISSRRPSLKADHDGLDAKVAQAAKVRQDLRTAEGLPQTVVSEVNDLQGSGDKSNIAHAASATGRVSLAANVPKDELVKRKKKPHTSGMAKHSAVFDGSADAGDMYGYEESTFSIPKALSLFFGVVLMAGIFFGGGYHMGHSAALNQQAAAIPGALSSAAPVYPAKEKPAAALEATETPAATQSSPEAVVTENVAISTPPMQENPKASKASAAQIGSFTVQVAAVRHQEDAEALLSALRKKQYPVFLASANSDSLFHVQVGPFPNQKEADAMRAHLAGDGYNAIVKK